MNCYLSTNSLVDAIGTRLCYMKESELRNWIKLSRQSLDNFHCNFNALLSWFVLYVPWWLFELPTTKFCTVYSHNLSKSRKHLISWEAVMHIARVCERLPELQIQFRISRSFRRRKSGKSGIINPFLNSPKGTHLKGNSPEKEVGVPRPPALDLPLKWMKQVKRLYFFSTSRNVVFP